MKLLPLFFIPFLGVAACTQDDSLLLPRHGRLQTLPATFRIDLGGGRTSVKLALVDNRAYLYEVYSDTLAERLRNRSGSVPITFKVSKGWLKIVAVDDWTLPPEVDWSSGMGCGEGDPSFPLCNPDGTPPVEPNPFTR